jgi:putative ABC transport system permease protein
MRRTKPREHATDRVIPRLRLFARLSIAHARRHRTRTLLTCGGVALGVASVTAVLALSRSITDAFERSIVRGAGAAQLQVSNGSAGVDRNLVDVLAKVHGIAATGATVEHQVALPVVGGRITILGVELGRNEAYRELQVGPNVADIPDALRFIANTDSIALSSQLLEQHRWKLGDTIDVLGARGPHRLVIRGTLRARGALEAFGGAVALMDLDAAQLRFGDPTKVHWIDLVVAPDASVDALQDSIARSLAGQATVEPPAMRGHRIERIMSLLRGLLTTTSVIAMLVGVFLIHHALATSYRQRRPDFVRLRQLGVSRRGVLIYLLAEAGGIGALASTLGLAFGIAFWRLATRDFSYAVSQFTFPLPPVTFAMSPLELAGVIALGTLAVVLGALSPAFGMLRVRPAALRGPVPTTGGGLRTVLLAVGGVVFAVLGAALAPLAHDFAFTGQLLVISAVASCLFIAATLVVPLVLATAKPLVAGARGRDRALLRRWMWHQVWRNRLHTATTTGALAAGVAYAIALTILLGSYRSALTDWIDQMFAGDVVLSAGPNLSLLGGQTVDHGVVDAIATLDGVAAVKPWRLLEARFRGEPIVVQAVPDVTLALVAPGVALTDDTALVSDSFAEHFHVATGDTVTIPAPRHPLVARVTAVVPDFVLHLGTVKLTWHSYIDHFGDDRVSFAFVDASPGVDPSRIKERIDARFVERYDLATFLSSQVHATIELLTDQTLAMTSWLQVLAALVAVAAMVNATSASIIDREHELRTWRALGLLRGSLVRLLVAEAVFVAAIGSALGFVSGAILGELLTTTIAAAMAGYRLTPRFPVGTLAIVPLLSTTAAAVAAAVVARRWTRTRALASAAARS